MGRVRLELVADFGANRGKVFSGVLVEPTYDAIVQAALNKLKLRRKEGLLLVLRDKHRSALVLSRAADLSTILRDGSTVVLATERPEVQLPKPPRWPWPCSQGAGTASESISELEPAEAAEQADDGSSSLHEVSFSIGDAAASKSLSLADWCELSAPQQPTAESDVWPRFEGNVLPLLRQAIGKMQGFFEKHLDGYIAFDYSASGAAEMAAMFPDPQGMAKKSSARLLAAVRRECRGLLVCAQTGHVLARRFPKFFNVDELEETRVQNLPADCGTATEKLDGSLVSPFILADKLRWATKASISSSVESFVQQPGWQHCLQKVEALVQQGMTPLFEWCEAGRRPPGVMQHSRDRLVLVAVRCNVTGNFWKYSELVALGCDVARRVEASDLLELLARTRRLEGTEGVVVLWPEIGKLVKIKTAWWTALSAAQMRGLGQPALALRNALQSIPLSSVPPALVWQAALLGDDDSMALVYSQLCCSSQLRFRNFVTAVEKGTKELSDELQEWAELAFEASEADVAKAAGGWSCNLLQSYIRRSPACRQELRKFLARLAMAGEVRGLEVMVRAVWDNRQEILEPCGHLGSLDAAREDLMRHCIDTYLPRKLEEYMGTTMSDESIVRVEPLHGPSEGKISGMWEQFVADGIIDLRLDLQPRAKVFDCHNGDVDFAYWQFQYGPNDDPRSSRAKEGDSSGSFAGVLMRTGVDTEFRQLREAFELSFKLRQTVKLEYCPTRISHIYVDLDGVLVDFEAGFARNFGEMPTDAKLRWCHIEETVGFYENLPWIDGARKLWQQIHQSNVNATVLTGVPEGHLGARSADEKRRWVSRELGPDIEVVTCLSRDKAQFSGPGRLLIDDRSHPGWEQAGGRQIPHLDVKSTLRAMAELGLGNRLLSDLEDTDIATTLPAALPPTAMEEVATEVEYTAIFLSLEARRRLLQKVAPLYSEVKADHFTLAYRPLSIKDLAVGAQVNICIDAIGSDGNVQAVSGHSVEQESRRGHITISHRQHAAAKDANHLSFSECEPFHLDGVVGLSVLLPRSKKVSLPQKVLARVEGLREGLPGQSEVFTDLSDAERRTLHELAGRVGFEHHSEGNKNTRQRSLILTVPKRWRPGKEEGVNDHSQRVIVHDQRKFAAVFGRALVASPLHGRVQPQGKILWGCGVPSPFGKTCLHGQIQGCSGGTDSRFAVILRGYPGSGKSNVAAALKESLGAVVVSADERRERGGPNITSQEAHAGCRSLFADVLDQMKSVIVDNTNIRLSEYAYYRTKAEAAGYFVVVLELVCESTQMLEQLRQRSVHNVPGAAAGGMWSRWELDASAYRLAPFMPEASSGCD